MKFSFLFFFPVELQHIICENFKVASLVIQHREKYPNLKHIVLIDDTESIDDLRNTDINVISFKELEVCKHSIDF